MMAPSSNPVAWFDGLTTSCAVTGPVPRYFGTGLATVLAGKSWNGTRPMVRLWEAGLPGKIAPGLKTRALFLQTDANFS